MKHNDDNLIRSATGALELLKNGAIGVLPTDTVYGLVALVMDQSAVERMYALKHRKHKPGTVIAASIEQLIELGLDETELQRVRQWWPGALSVVIPAHEDLAYLHQGVGSLAVRVPGDTRVREWLQHTGPLMTTSANHPGEPGAVSVAKAQSYFDGAVDFYVDGGDLSGREPSTVVRWEERGLKILRQGAVEVRPGTCVFCLENGLLNGDILAETTEVFMIAAASRNGNYLIIPKVHIEDPAHLPANWWRGVRQVLPQVPGLGKHYNLSFNVGHTAGQTVPHLHLWVVPRTAGGQDRGMGLVGLIEKVNTNAATIS
ncbi:threonylcarbamoyl-AMP synthase [bacterium]|nr:MAG: threonylcarbamoyl-AMP synthase [bacterium]